MNPNDIDLLLRLNAFEKGSYKKIHTLIKIFDDYDEACQTAYIEIIDPSPANVNPWRKCVEADGISLIISLLKKNMTIVSVCKDASLTLTKMLASPHPDLKSPNWPDVDCVIAEDGIKTLVSIMFRHFDNIDVCVNACQVLGLIALLSGIKCVEADIIPLLIDLIDEKCENEILMEHVSNLLFHITETCYLIDEDNEELIIPIIKILEYHPYNTAICDAAVSTLKNIISRNDSYLKIAVENFARDALITVQDNHPIGTIQSLNSVLHKIAKKDFEQHPHDLIAITNYNHSCDICGAMSGNYMNCKGCDYDECMLCFRK